MIQQSHYKFTLVQLLACKSWHLILILPLSQFRHQCSVDLRRLQSTNQYWNCCCYTPWTRRVPVDASSTPPPPPLRVKRSTILSTSQQSVGSSRHSLFCGASWTKCSRFVHESTSPGHRHAPNCTMQLCQYFLPLVLRLCICRGCHLHYYVEAVIYITM